MTACEKGQSQVLQSGLLSVCSPGSMRRRTKPVLTVVIISAACEISSRLVTLRVAGTETCGSPLLNVVVTVLRMACRRYACTTPQIAGRVLFPGGDLLPTRRRGPKCIDSQCCHPEEGVVCPTKDLCTPARYHGTLTGNVHRGIVLTEPSSPARRTKPVPRPGGTNESSPAFQRRMAMDVWHRLPEGRLNARD